MAKIGELSTKLNNMAVDIPLAWSDNEDMGFRILDVCSYRGYYDQAAIIVELVDIDMADNVSHLSKCLKTLKSQTFMGYKGGDYNYDDNTEVFLVESESATQFRSAARTIKVKSDGTFKDKKSSY